MRSILTLNWFSSKWPIAIAAAVMGFLANSGLDQVIRNRVDEHMYGYALREMLPTGIEAYQAMPIHWRQVISELSLRRQITGDAESKLLFATLEHFDATRLSLVDKIVPYVMFDFLLRDPSQTDTQHPIPNVVYADFLDLESLGVLQSVARGTIIQRDISSSQYVIQTGSHILTVRSAQGPGTLQFPTTRISEPWLKLIALLRVPTNPDYIQWFVSNVESMGFQVEATRK